MTRIYVVQGKGVFQTMTVARVVVVLVLSAVDLFGGILAVAAPVPPPKEEEKNVVER